MELFPVRGFEQFVRLVCGFFGPVGVGRRVILRATRSPTISPRNHHLPNWVRQFSTRRTDSSTRVDDMITGTKNFGENGCEVAMVEAVEGITPVGKRREAEEDRKAAYGLVGKAY